MKRSVLLAGIVLLAVFGWYVFLAPEQSAVPFSHEGNLIKDNPGLEPGAWHLSYESPGAPALTKKLIFDVDSRCGTADALAVCDLSFTQGQRAQVAGTEEGDAVRVATLVFEMPHETGTTVMLYFYDPKRDTDAAGNILCSAQGLVPVERVLPQGATAEDAVRLLLRGEISEAERAQGITSEFPLPGVALASSSRAGGVLTLTFDDPQNKTGGGSCRVGILWRQIEATAKQFSGIESVRFAPEELFQP